METAKTTTDLHAAVELLRTDLENFEKQPTSITVSCDVRYASNMRLGTLAQLSANPGDAAKIIAQRKTLVVELLLAFGEYMAIDERRKELTEKLLNTIASSKALLAAGAFRADWHLETTLRALLLKAGAPTVEPTCWVPGYRYLDLLGLHMEEAKSVIAALFPQMRAHLADDKLLPSLHGAHYGCLAGPKIELDTLRPLSIPRQCRYFSRAFVQTAPLTVRVIELGAELEAFVENLAERRKDVSTKELMRRLDAEKVAAIMHDCTPPALLNAMEELNKRTAEHYLALDQFSRLQEQLRERCLALRAAIDAALSEYGPNGAIEHTELQLLGEYQGAAALIKAYEQLEWVTWLVAQLRNDEKIWVEHQFAGHAIRTLTADPATQPLS